MTDLECENNAKAKKGAQNRQLSIHKLNIMKF